MLTPAELADKLGEIPKNLNFANAISLTRTAQLCKKAVQDNIPDVFDTRNNWSKNSVRITAADYKSNAEPQAEIYVKDSYLADQELGRTRKLGTDEAIPLTLLYQETKAQPMKVIPRGLRAGALARNRANAKGKPFVARTKDGRSFLFVRKLDGSGIAPIYKLQDANIGDAESYQVKKREFFHDTVQDTYEKNIEEQWEAAFDKYVIEAAMK